MPADRGERQGSDARDAARPNREVGAIRSAFVLVCAWLIARVGEHGIPPNGGRTRMQNAPDESETNLADGERDGLGLALGQVAEVQAAIDSLEVFLEGST